MCLLSVSAIAIAAIAAAIIATPATGSQYLRSPSRRTADFMTLTYRRRSGVRLAVFGRSAPDMRYATVPHAAQSWHLDARLETPLR